MGRRDGGYTLATDLPTLFKPEEIVSQNGERLKICGMQSAKHSLTIAESSTRLAVFDAALSSHASLPTSGENKFIHKGNAARLDSESVSSLGYPVHAKPLLDVHPLQERYSLRPKQAAKIVGSTSARCGNTASPTSWFASTPKRPTRRTPNSVAMDGFQNGCS